MKLESKLYQEPTLKEDFHNRSYNPLEEGLELDRDIRENVHDFGYNRIICACGCSKVLFPVTFAAGFVLFSPIE